MSRPSRKTSILLAFAFWFRFRPGRGLVNLIYVSHLTMNRFPVLRLALIATLSLAAVPGMFGQGGSDYSATDFGAGKFERRPFLITTDLRVGYDSNVNTTYFNPHSSGFFNLAINIAYTASSPRSTLTIGAGVNFVFYFDPAPNTQEFQVNAKFNIAWTYKISPRMSLAISTANVYGTQPEYTIVGLNSRVAGNYFYSANRVALGYQFTSRFSTITSFVPIIVLYEEEPYKTGQNRVEYYFSEELRYLIQPTVTLVGEYRFSYIDYLNFNRLDSTSNYVIGGLDASLSPRLKLSLRGGAQFADYSNSNRTTVASPYFEGSMSYDYQKYSNIAFILRYGVEQTDVAGTLYRQGFRMGVNIRHQLTPRISLSGSFYYTNAYYTGDPSQPLLNPGRFSDNIFDTAVGARYAINRNFSIDVGYLYTFVDSPLLGRSYNRNRVFAGVRFQF